MVTSRVPTVASREPIVACFDVFRCGGCNPLGYICIYGYDSNLYICTVVRLKCDGKRLNNHTVIEGQQHSRSASRLTLNSTVLPPCGAVSVKACSICDHWALGRLFTRNRECATPVSNDVIVVRADDLWCGSNRQPSIPTNSSNHML